MLIHARYSNQRCPEECLVTVVQLWHSEEKGRSIMLKIVVIEHVSGLAFDRSVIIDRLSYYICMCAHIKVFLF